jgi:hypothetical protein
VPSSRGANDHRRCLGAVITSSRRDLGPCYQSGPAAGRNAGIGAKTWQFGGRDRPESTLAEPDLTAGALVDTSSAQGRPGLTSIKQPGRAGWAEASRALAEAGDDVPAWPEFGNAEDGTLDW